MTQPTATTEPSPDSRSNLISAIVHSGRSLSPSRASDFKTCPLLYRLRAIDRIPEQPSREAIRGTVVHAVLEQLFELPAAQRLPDRATELVEPQWKEALAENPGLAELFDSDLDGPDVKTWLDSAKQLVLGYFALENPQQLEPAAREHLVEALLDDGPLLRGYIDRLDIAPTGEIRVVDYKTGTIPREAFETKALFQMKFYALILWRTRGAVPTQLRLMYLNDRDTLTYAPTEDELRRFEGILRAIWQAINRALSTGVFLPKPSRLCSWCNFTQLCPEFGGTPPPFPSLAQDAVTASDVEMADTTTAE